MREEVGKVGNGGAGSSLGKGMRRWTKRIEERRAETSQSGPKVGDEYGERRGDVGDER